jgi:hypothetical protein
MRGEIAVVTTIRCAEAGRNRAPGGAVRHTRNSVLTLQYGVPFCGWPSSERMSQQPEVTTISDTPMAPPIVGPITADAARMKAAEGSAKPDPGHGPQRIPRWLERAELFLRVLLRMYIGITVCYAPWSPLFWDQNPLFTRFPTLGVYAAHGAVRGIVSGIGLLNLWIAFRDVIRHRDG